MITNTNTLDYGTDEQGKWSWKSMLVAVLNGFASGGLVGAAMGGLGYALDQMKPPTLPPGELEAISTWMRNVFTPYFNTLIAEGNNLLENNFNTASLSQLNVLANKLCVLKNYYFSINDDVLLSQEGFNFRYAMIEPFCSAFENLLQQKALELNAIPTTAVFNVATFNIPLLPQPQSGTISCTNYTLQNTAMPIAKTETPMPIPAEQKTDYSWLWLTIAVGTVILLLPNQDEKETIAKK